MSADREAPTPRLTASWELHRDLAHQLSERCRAFAHASAEVGQSRRLRSLSDACEEYARAFAAWSLADVPIAQKMRERTAFSHVTQAIAEELGT